MNLKSYLILVLSFVLFSFTFLVKEEQKEAEHPFQENEVYVQFDTLNFNISNRLTHHIFSSESQSSSYRYEKFNR